MLVEINLLPQKQRRSSTIIRLVLLLSIIMLISALLTAWQVQRYKSRINSLENNIANSEQLILDLQQNMDTASTNSYVELSNAVEWSTNHPIKSVPVLQHLTSLLPERGFLLNYAYSDTGTISLTVQFDTKKEAAFYLKWLTDSAWVKEVKLSNLTSSQTETSISDSNGDSTNLQSEENNYLPRYTGNFEITLNSEKIREIQQKEDTTIPEEEGGDED
jgi:type IV pilus assembly protein PilN